jgi:hypothetical protein
VRTLVWSALAVRLHALLRRCDVAVLPNDAAYPYDRLARLLRERGTPFVLLQEGVRFPLPGVGAADSYGSGGARAVAAWGETSAAYFRSRGVSDDAIHLTGTPRFDGLLSRDRGDDVATLRRRLGVGDRVMLFLSNPIDDQGFCTTEEKYELFRAFCTSAAPVLERAGYRLVIRLHGREDHAAFQRVLDQTALRGRATIDRESALHSLLSLAAAAVVLASTVGLEALVFGLRLGVQEIPGAGYVHDYVQRGAAIAIPCNGAAPSAIEQLIAGDGIDVEAVRCYVDLSLAAIDGASGRVAAVIDRVSNT